MNTNRTYHIHYPRDFANEYSLCYCTSDEEREEATAAGYERITLKEALRKCRNERCARKQDSSFSGFGSADILPWAFIKKDTEYSAKTCGGYLDPEYDGHLKLNGYIWE